MATEDIQIKDGRIQVERFGAKENVDVALSDVDSFSFTRGGEAQGQSDGALVLYTENGSVVIRVADEDAGKVLQNLYDASPKTEQTEQSTGPAVQDGEPVGAPANESENAPIEQPVSSSTKRRTTK